MKMMHWRWCTEGEALKVMHGRWCTEGGDALKVMHWRWCTEGYVQKVMYWTCCIEGDALMVMMVGAVLGMIVVIVVVDAIDQDQHSALVNFLCSVQITCSCCFHWAFIHPCSVETAATHYLHWVLMLSGNKHFLVKISIYIGLGVQ